MTRKFALFGCFILCILVFAVSGGPDLVAQAGTGAAPALAASAAPLLVTQVSAGFEHTCVLVSGGSVYCWGSNRYGQLGNPDQTIHPFPQPVSISGATTIAAGGYHTCAIISGGAVACWGQNSSGQLGNGTTTNSTSPVTVTGISGATAIAAGYDYTCALVGGGAQCWGDDLYGQLGNGVSGVGVLSSTPVAVSSLAGASTISAGFDHTCALTGGTIQCWGRNNHGQLGNASTTDSSTPVGVSGSGFKSVAAGAQHTCAITSSNGVDCWGDGSLGQMGNGATTGTNSSPVAASISNVTALSAGGYSDTGHNCARTASGGVQCWGSNDFGQIGNGVVADAQNSPVGSLASGVSAITVGVNHSCALMTDQTVQCWGSDSSGQLGDGVNSVSTIPIQVLGGETGVTQVGTGDRNTCAIVHGGVRCWGNNRNYQIGDGTSINRPGLTGVTGLSGSVTTVDSGMNQSCAIVNGGVQCWGNAGANNKGPLAALSGASSGVTSLSMTNLHGCLVMNGGVQCWGDDSHGQLGDGLTTGTRTAPFAIPSLSSGIKTVATGQWFSCALADAGSVYCWGDDTNGQLGIGSASVTPSPSPQLVGGLSGVTMLAAGQDHACALTAAGAVFCWGNNQQGQLGDGTQVQHPIPTLVPTLASGVTQVTAGGFHTCALVNGGVKCWGFNSFGQLGNGTTNFSKTPVNVSNLTSGVTAVAAGGINYDEEQTCAITVQQALICWGGDEYGQLGDNLPILRAAPVKVLGLAGVPELGINYTSGQAGSFFRLAAANFPASTLLTVLVNGHFVGSVTTTKAGYAFFHFHPTASLTGAISVSISGTTASVGLNLTAGSGTLHVQEGSGPVVGSAPVRYFLPAIVH